MYGLKRQDVDSGLSASECADCPWKTVLQCLLQQAANNLRQIKIARDKSDYKLEEKKKPSRHHVPRMIIHDYLNVASHDIKLRIR